MSAKKRGEEKKLTPEEFILRAIDTLAGPKYKGIHTVFSGCNQAFRAYFEGADPVPVIKQMHEEGKISLRPTFRGVLIAKPGVLKPIVPKDVAAKATLGKMRL